MGSTRQPGVFGEAQTRRSRVLATLQGIDGVPATALDVWGLMDEPRPSQHTVMADLQLLVANGLASRDGARRTTRQRFAVTSKGRRAKGFVDQTTLRVLARRSVTALRIVAARGPIVETAPGRGDASRVWTTETGLAAATAYSLAKDGFLVVTKPTPLAKRTTRIELSPAGLMVAEGHRPNRAEAERANRAEVVVRTLAGPQRFPKPPPAEVVKAPPVVDVTVVDDPGAVADAVREAMAPPVPAGSPVQPTWFDHVDEHELVADPPPAAVEDPMDRVLDLAQRIKDAEHLVASLRAELAAVVAGIRP